MLRKFPSVLLTLAATFLAASAARAAIEFTGILVTPHQSVFTLRDDATGKSAWHKLGESFAGYDLTAYDAATDTITLSKDGVLTRVRLKDAKIQSARVELSGAFTIGHGDTTEVTRATLVLGEETTFPLKDGYTLRLKAERRPDGNILYRAAFEHPRPDGTVERQAAPSVIALPGGSFSVKIGELGFSFGVSSS